MNISKWLRYNQKLIVLLTVVMLLFTGGLAAIQFAAPVAVNALQTQSTPAPPTGQKTLIVVGDQLFPPYEFLENGQPTGFNVELLQAVAETMGLSLEIRLLPWSEARHAIETGQADIITGMFYSVERDKLVDFSVPHTSVSSGLFVRNNTPYKNLADLQGKAIIVQEGDIMDDYLREENFDGEIFLVTEPIEGLRLLASGRYDAVLLSSRLQGQYYMRRYLLTNLRVEDTGLPARDYSFAVAQGNQDLVSRLNEGLNILDSTGRYKEITNKWFRVYKEPLLSELWPYLLAGLGIISLLLLASFFWTRSLQKEINLRTNQLMSSEQKYADLIDRANEGIAIVQNTDIVFLNPNGRNILGLPGGVELPISVEPYIPSLQSLVESFVNLSQANTRVDLNVRELEIINHEGQRRTIEVSIAPLEWQGVESSLVFFVDRTQRHEFEKALLEKEEHFRLLFNEAPLSYQALDDSGCFITVNNTWLSILGYAREEVIGHPFSEFLIKEETELFNKQFPLFKKAGEINDLELHMRCKNGKVLTVSYNGRVSHNLDGSFRQTHCIFEDVTEQRKALDALRESEERFRRIFEDSVLGVFQTNDIGEISIFNRSFAQMHGFDSKEELAQLLNSPQVDEDMNGLVTIWKETTQSVIETQAPLVSQLSITKHKNNGSFIGQVHAWPVTDPSGKFQIVEGYVEDVSEIIKNREAINNLAKFPQENPNPVLRVDQMGKIIYANPSSTCLLETWGTQIGGVLPDPLLKTVNEVYSTGKIQVINHPCGSLTFSITFTPVTGQNYINLYATDITATLSYLEALKSSEAKFSTAFLLSPDSIIISGIEDGYLFEINEGFLELTGYTREEVIGKTTKDIHLWADPIQREAIVNKVQISGEVDNIEVELCLKNGSKRIGLFSARTISYEGQTRLLSIFHDIHERIIDKERIARSLNQLNALRSIDMFISASTDLQIILNAILEQVVSQLKVDAASIHLVNPTSHLVELAAETGLSLSFHYKKSVPLNQSLARQAIQERTTIHHFSPSNPPIRIEHNTFAEYFAVPLIAKGQIQGVLELYNRTNHNVDQEWLKFLEALAGQSAIAIENANMFENLEVKNLQLIRAYTSIIEGWARALELRDGETEGHVLFSKFCQF